MFSIVIKYLDREVVSSHVILTPNVSLFQLLMFTALTRTVDFRPWLQRKLTERRASGTSACLPSYL